MDEEVIHAAQEFEENSHSDNLNDQNVSEQDLQNVSPEIRDLLDMFAKQNKEDKEQVNNIETNKEVLVYEELQFKDKEYLTLYATNDEASTEPQVIQFNPEDVSNEYSTYFDSNQVDMAAQKSFQVFDIDPRQVKNSYQTFISPKSSQDSTSFNTSVKSDAEISLNSSGYISASSPIDSIANSPTDSASSPKESENHDSSRTLSPDPLSLPSPDPHVSENSNSSNSNNPCKKIQKWVKKVYPELYQTLESLSASEFYQGGVELLCSICKKNPYSGFHENLPVCEADRVGRACTVCRLRSASGFSYGLALCEADRLFLYRTFSQETKLERCVTMCPVTVQKWCGYCRLKTCLSTKGFRFFTEASTRIHIDQQEPAKDTRKRKYSGKGVIKELNFIPDTVAQDSVFIHNDDASFPRPEFGCPTPAQAKYALGNDNPAQSKLSMPKRYQNQSLAEANPTLLQALSQPISMPMSSYNQVQATNFAKPSFNLRPGMSKAEFASFQASSAQARAPTTQARVITPHPTAGVASTASYSQQPGTVQGRADNPLPPTSSQSRAYTSTPLPSSFNDKSLSFMPTNNFQMGRYGQFPPNMAYMQQHLGRSAPLLLGPGSAPHIPESMPHHGRSTPLSSALFPNPQSQLHHPQANPQYTHQDRQHMPSVATPYFNGAALGTRNKKMSGNVGVLMDPMKQNWVGNQQDKYLRYHLRLYRARGK